MKTTTLSVLVLVLLACGTVTRAQDVSRTNVAHNPPLLAKALPMLLADLAGAKASLPALDKGDLTLSLQVKSKKEVQSEEAIPTNMVSAPLVLIPKDPFPNLYYVHLEDNPLDRDASRDDVGRIWKLSPRTTLLFPFGRWDNPGIQERVLLGFCLHYKLK